MKDPKPIVVDGVELEGISFGGWRDGPYLCAYEKCEKELPLNRTLVMRTDTNQVFCCIGHAVKGRAKENL